MVAKSMTTFAKDVWKGMSKGVDKGRKFVVDGNKLSNKSIKDVSVKYRERNKDAVDTIRKVRVAMNNNKDNVNLGKKYVSQTKANNSFGVHVGDFLGGTTRDTIKNYKAGETNVLKAFNEANKTNGKYDMKKVAGSYVAATSAGRVISGGGITKDRNGNSNLIGIPFI